MRFRILGPLEFWTGQEWAGISAAKWRALLATLLLNLGQIVPTDRLIAELWGDDPPDKAANLVSVYVFRLRRLLGDPGGRVLTTRAPGFRLAGDPDELDARHFEALVMRGRQQLAAGDAQLAARSLAEALGLWRGRALADVPQSPSVALEAERLEEARVTALELRIEADLGRGLAAELVPELRALSADQPLREGLWGLLMRALDAAGRHAEAVAVYAQARRIIADELGLDPGPPLQRLYQSMLGATPDHPPGKPRPGGPAGQRRSPGANAGTPALAAVAPRSGGGGGSPAATPEPPGRAARVCTPTREPGAAAPPRPAQLPADVADFTGRGDHVRQLRSLLTDPRRAGNPAVTVVVVAGAPGLGKTALAVHAAHALRRGFPDGQLYVNLRGASEQSAPPDEVLARFLRDLGVYGTRIPVDAEERGALYRTMLAERRMLVVLDDAGDAAQVRPLLPGTGSCAVIVTSRHRLADLAGSRLVDLDVFGGDEALDLFGRIIGPERAAAEPGPVSEVLAACAGLPLAIRIAGARLMARRGWTVRALADRLADARHRIDELAAGDLAVRACFQVSFAALPRRAGNAGADPAHAFRLLGAWQGPSIGLQAAAALLGQPSRRVAEALEVLVDAHLLESPAPDRYAFHDLLRVYAAERAEADEPPGEIQAAMHRLLTWYLRTADAAASVVSPYRDRVPLEPPRPGQEAPGFGAADQALHWCAAERANIVAATRQAAALGLHDIAWELPVAVMGCFDLQGYRAEWITTHRVALDSARRLGDRRAEAWVLNNLGMVLSQQRAAQALGLFQQALAICREIGDRRGQARAANNLAFNYRFLGRHQEAAAASRHALDVQREVGHRYGEGIALCNLGEAYLELGRLDEAIARSHEALAICRELGSARIEGYALYNLGRAHLELGRDSDAADLLDQALASHRATGDRYGEAQDLQHIGTVFARTGRPAEAVGALQDASRLFDRIGEAAQAEEVRAQLGKLSAE